MAELVKPPPPVDLRKGAREDYALPRCTDKVKVNCLEQYLYPPTPETLQALSVTEPASKLDWRFFLGVLLIGTGVFLYRKR